MAKTSAEFGYWVRDIIAKANGRTAFGEMELHPGEIEAASDMTGLSVNLLQRWAKYEVPSRRRELDTFCRKLNVSDGARAILFEAAGLVDEKQTLEIPTCVSRLPRRSKVRGMQHQVDTLHESAFRLLVESVQARLARETVAP